MPPWYEHAPEWPPEGLIAPSRKAQVTTMLATSQQDLDRARQNPAQLVTNGGEFPHSGKLLHAHGLTSWATNSG